MTLEQLVGLDPEGAATVDGAGSAIAVGELRRTAVDAGYLPMVLGGDDEKLNVGREKRLFSPAQCVALLERDGGCAMCGAPPSHCEAHHIEWWDRDGGRTDLAKGATRESTL
ncbi:HNH endonuclease signature motif containing protein [Demequina aestuarii]|uniref:HNH endonuclease signature motif containing protein n=1 Tax=Demequina aestuarii TaxID=327095 RepID=UPI001EE70793|nr:HNH endonuclease signature motif containing protein [Demequina aestuarii]